MLLKLLVLAATSALAPLPPQVASRNAPVYSNGALEFGAEDPRALDEAVQTPREVGAWGGVQAPQSTRSVADVFSEALVQEVPWLAAKNVEVAAPGAGPSPSLSTAAAAPAASAAANAAATIAEPAMAESEAGSLHADPADSSAESAFNLEDEAQAEAAGAKNSSAAKATQKQGQGPKLDKQGQAPVAPDESGSSAGSLQRSEPIESDPATGAGSDGETESQASTTTGSGGYSGKIDGLEPKKNPRVSIADFIGEGQKLNETEGFLGGFAPSDPNAPPIQIRRLPLEANPSGSILPSAPEVLEVTLSSAYTGTGFQEVFLLQLPRLPSEIAPSPVLVAFHKFSNTAKDITANTTFSQEAFERNWFMVAPLGAVTQNFGFPVAQTHTELVLDLLLTTFGSYIDRSRVYGVGFSMGGGWALSYGARHVDPDDLIFAALVNHTGGVSLKNSYENESAPVKAVLEQAYGGPPASFPFEYQASSIIEFNAMTLEVDRDTDMARNLTHIPILSVRASNDSLLYPTTQNEVFESHFASIGGNLTLDIVPDVFSHLWSTLDFTEACDWLAQYELTFPKASSSMAHQDGRFYYFDIEQDASGAFTPFTWRIRTRENEFQLVGTENLDRISFDPVAVGLTLNQPLHLRLNTFDGISDHLRLYGIEDEPVLIQRDGISSSAFTYDGLAETLTIEETDGSLHLWDIWSLPSAADLMGTITVDDSTPIESQVVMYTITLANLGQGKASNVRVTDLLPAGLSFDSAAPSQGSYNDLTGVWTVGKVSNGSSPTLDIFASVDVGTGGDIIANAITSVSAKQPDPDNLNDLDSIQITVENDADLSVSKVVDVTYPVEGQQIVYTISLENLAGGAQATGVTLSDLLPTGVTYFSDLPSQGSYNDLTGLWTVGTLNSGSTATLDITADVDLGTFDTTIVNTADSPALDQTDPNATNDSDSASITVVDFVDLALTKVVDLPAPFEQDNVTYTLTLTNETPTVTATNVSLVDLLPAGVTYVSDTPSQGSYEEITGLWNVGSLAGSAVATLDITASVDVGSGGQLIVNTADTLVANQPDPDLLDNSDSASITVDGEADLNVAKLVDDATPRVGENVVYTITVSNPSGGAQATSVSLTDMLPSGVTYVSDLPSQGSYVSGTGVWTIGTIDAGADATLTLTASVDAAQEGNAIVNTATITALDQTDSNAANDSDTAQIDVEADVDISVTKIVDDATPNEQDTVVYTITVANGSATDSATGVEVTDLLPAGVTYVSEIASQGTYVSGTGVWTVGTIAASGNATLDITATVDEATGGDAIVNNASVTALEQSDANGANDSDSAQIDVSNEADLAVAKVVDDATPRVGENVVYTVTVSNPSGGAQATTVSLTDLLPAGVTYVSDVPSQGSYVSGTGVWTIGTINAGADATLAITASVDAAQEGNAIVNTATITALDQTDSNAANDSDTAQIDVEADVDISVTKVVDDATPNEQDTVVYTITVANGSATDSATGVEVTDLLPAGVTYVSEIASQGTYVSGTGVWTVGTIAASGNATLDITATVDEATGGDAIVNNASVTALEQSDANGANDSDSAQIDVSNEADLAVAKVVDDATPRVGENVVYTVTVSNPSGGAQATTVSLTDLLPSGVTYVSDVPSQGSYVSGTGVWTIGTINAGADATLAITASVDAAQEGNAIVNTATITALDQTDSNAANDSDTAQIDVEADVDLAVTKIVDDATPNEQDTVVYTITVANGSATDSATGVEITDLLPAGVTYVSEIASQGTYVSGTGVWTVGTIAASGNATLDITATVDEATGGDAIVNNASVTALEQSDANGANDSDSAQIDVSNEADLAVAKVVDDATPRVGENVVYTVTVSNPSGGAQATTVSLTDLLPAGVTYVSNVPSQGSYVSGTGVWTIGTINAGADATLAITASVDAAQEGNAIVNTATITALDQTDSNAANDSDTAQIDVEADVDISVTKVVDDATPNEQDTVVYTITVANGSATDSATGVEVTDLFPAGVTYVSEIASQGTYVSGTGVWTIGTIAASSNATLDITATVDEATGGDAIVNNASVTALEQSDSNGANDSDSAQIDVSNEADLAVAKVVDDATPRVGDSVVYTVTVSNPSGGAQATTVSLTDMLPSGVTYVSDLPSQGSYVSGTGVWTIGTINAGADATLTLTASVDAAQEGNAIVNTATITALDQTDSNAANDSDTAQIDVEADVDISVTKIVDDATPNEQDTVVYTVTVANGSATDSATGVEVTDLLPAGVTYVSEIASQGTYVSGTGVWTIGTIGASSNATLDITATVDEATGGDAIVNNASVTALEQSDSNGANDSDSAQIDVSNEADLAVAKVVDDATPRVGDSVVYTVTVSNPSGGAQATTVSLTDQLPSGVTYVSDLPSQGSYVSGTGVWTIGTIDAGADATLTLTASVDAAQEGNAIVNTATITALDQTDSNAANDSDTAQIDVEADVDISVTKIVDDATPNEQDTVVYTITVANGSATDSATGVEVTDLLPAGVTYVSEIASQGTYVSGTGVWTVGTIAASGNATLDITATVDEATGGDAIVNNASVTALEQSDANGANDSDSAQIDVSNEADLAVSKVVDDATPRVGDSVVYTVTVSNPSGGAQATTVSLTDLLPSGVTYVSDVPSQGSYVSGTGVWTIGTINAGGNATLAITASVDTAQEGNAIVNTATITALDQTDSNGANDSDTAQIDVEADIDLSVTKVVDDATPNEQDTVVYTITVANGSGTDGATNVVIGDLLPSGVTYVSDNPSQGTYVSGTGVWTVGTIAASGNATLDITATVDIATGGDAIVNTASVTSFDQSDSTPANDSDTAQIDVSNEADLAVTKVVDDATPRVGENVVYTVTVSNPSGGAQATTVSLTDLLPSGVTYVSDVPSQGSYVSGTGVWTVGTINAGADATLAITASVDAAQEGNAIVNTATITALDQTDSNAANDSDTAQIDVEADIDLSVTKVVDDATPNEQDTVVYTITVANGSGTDGATNVVIGDLLPSGVTYVSDNPSQGTYVSGTGVWTVGTIAASGNATLGITATVDAATGGDAIVNTASVTSFDQSDSTPANDSDTAQIDVSNEADLAVTKVVDDATPRVGENVVYTVTVSNPSGGAQATTVSLTDLLPSGVTYVSDVPSQGSYVSGTGVWTIGTINAGANATLAITASVDAAQEGNAIVNTATITALDQTDSNGTNDSDTAQIDVEADVDLSVTKVVDDATPNEQDTVVYTITVANGSATDGATNVVIGDLLPSGVTYVSDNPSQGTYVSGTGVWTVGTIAASGNATLGITATVDIATGGDAIVNTASVTSFDQSDSNASNDSDTAQIDVANTADLGVTNVVDVATPNESDTIVYTITISNPSGGAQATTVSLTDALPSGVTYVSDSPSQGSYVSGTGVWTVGTINAGSNASMTITCTVDTGTSGNTINNTTSGLSLDQTDSNSANDAATASITVN